MSDCRIAGYIPEIDLVRFEHEGTVYNIDGQVIADLWDAYVYGHGHDYDICADCELTEQEHGRWLRTDAYPHRIYCSECYATFIRNDEFLHLEDIPHNYCPNCGAKMDEQQEVE